MRFCECVNYPQSPIGAGDCLILHPIVRYPLEKWRWSYWAPAPYFYCWRLCLIRQMTHRSISPEPATMCVIWWAQAAHFCRSDFVSAGLGCIFNSSAFNHGGAAVATERATGVVTMLWCVRASGWFGLVSACASCSNCAVSRHRCCRPETVAGKRVAGSRSRYFGRVGLTVLSCADCHHWFASSAGVFLD